MAERTRTSTEAIRLGRLKKATQFLDAAIFVGDEMPDASVSLLVNAGIAARPSSVRGISAGQQSTA